MTERPILFNGAMVRAILRGQKTQTRRILESPYSQYGPFERVTTPEGFEACLDLSSDGYDFFGHPKKAFVCPFGGIGGRLWVRETFAQLPGHIEIAYRADFEEFTDDNRFRWPPKWRPSIHMPRALSRITLEITDINVERVWDITDPEAIAEGAREINHVGDVPSHPTWTMGRGMERYDSPREAFAAAWDSIYAKRGLGWNANPWVWVVEFELVEVR